MVQMDSVGCLQSSEQSLHLGGGAYLSCKLWAADFRQFQKFGPSENAVVSSKDEVKNPVDMNICRQLKKMWILIHKSMKEERDVYNSSVCLSACSSAFVLGVFVASSKDL